MLAACDLPTKVPQWEQQWVIPTDSARVSVSEMLPSEFTVVGGAFRMTLPGASGSRTLGSFCGCASTTTATPKPAFSGSLASTLTFSTDVLSADVATGSSPLVVNVSHNFNFDPIRPSATARGSVVVTVAHGGTTIGTATLSGTTSAFPAGAAQAISVPITPGSVLTGPITVTTTLNSPAGDPVVLNTSQSLTVTVVPSALTVTNVKVRVANKTVSAIDQPLDMAGVSTDLFGRVVEGAMLAAITNPFGVSGTLTLTINVPGRTPIAKSVAISSAATSDVSIAFTAAELEQMLGVSGVVMRMRGTVNGPAAGVSVLPTQSLIFANRLSLKVTVGG